MSTGRLRVRVDDRLLHTEVIYAVLEEEPVAHLIIASRLPWVEDVDTTLVPAATHVTVTTPERAARVVEPGQSTLLLVGTVDELERAAADLEPDVIALANRAPGPGTRELSPTFHVDEADRARLGSLVAAGRAIVTQRVPSEVARGVTVERLTELGSAPIGEESEEVGGRTC